MRGFGLRLQPLAVLLAGQSALLMVIAATNITDLAVDADLLATEWRSRNIDYIQNNLGHLDNQRWLAVLGVLIAACGQLLAGALYARSVVALLRRSSMTIEWVRLASAAAITLWMSLSLGVEVFVMYPGAGWSSFVLLMILAVVTWMIAEMSCSERPE